LYDRSPVNLIPGFCCFSTFRYFSNPRRVFPVICLVLAPFIVPANAATHRTASGAIHGCTIEQRDAQVTVANGFVKVVVDLPSHSIMELAADHTGSGTYRGNLLAKNGIRFEETETSLEKVARSIWYPTIVDHSSTRVIVDFRSKITDIVPQLHLSLNHESRSVNISVKFPTAGNASKPSKVSFQLRQFFLMGFFQRGAVQAISGQKRFFTSRDRPLLFYTLDREYGSVAVVPQGYGTAESTLFSGGDTDFATGVELSASKSSNTVDEWQPAALGNSVGGSSDSDSLPVTIAFDLYANDLPFPAHRQDQSIVSRGDTGNDATAYLEAVYGSAAGVLGSYVESGSAYPTLGTPDRPYGDAFNFFDPDAWPVVNTLSYSGDPILQQEARKVLERSESDMLPDGQLPHHFEHGKPVYLSIAQSKQTGPNIFWLLAAMDYAAATGNDGWLRSHYVHMQKAAEWLLDKFDSGVSLLKADGPLFIDVFRRSGYTLDTNVAAVWMLQRMAETAESCGDETGAVRYLDFARKIESGIRNNLWDKSDHFLTQRNPDGTTRDFVDYDGNFAAIALGVLNNSSEEAKLLHRLDSGVHIHPGGRGTWVSEKRYEKSDCYGDNDGDSDVAMARIWFFDMLARVHMKDGITFDSLLKNMEFSLLEDVWMPERYDAGGEPTHNSYYHEYPEIFDMVLREMRYGIQVRAQTVTIRPFGTHEFHFQMNTLQVDYSQSKVTLNVPGHGSRHLEIGDLIPHQEFKLSSGGHVVSDANGTLKFDAKAGTRISATRTSSTQSRDKQIFPGNIIK
jgi:hypothetical protein